MYQTTAYFFEILLVIQVVISAGRSVVLFIAELDSLKEDTAWDVVVVLLIVEIDPSQTLPYE
jgi:hypothetical protein